MNKCDGAVSLCDFVPCFCVVHFPLDTCDNLTSLEDSGRVHVGVHVGVGGEGECRVGRGKRLRVWVNDLSCRDAVSCHPFIEHLHECLHRCSFLHFLLLVLGGSSILSWVGASAEVGACVCVGGWVGRWVDVCVVGV